MKSFLKCAFRSDNFLMHFIFHLMKLKIGARSTLSVLISIFVENVISESFDTKNNAFFLFYASSVDPLSTKMMHGNNEKSMYDL